MQLPPDFQYSTLCGDPNLAWRQDGEGIGAAGVFFLPGFFSNMTGTKASFLAERCAASTRICTRFDYRGHGLSDGRFEDATISDWLEDALRVFDTITEGPQILVGSSMGGWIMLLMAQLRPERVTGLVGLAPAADFADDLLWNKLSTHQQKEMVEKGIIYTPSNYEDISIPFTMRLIEDGRRHYVLDKSIAINCPVRIIQGMQDTEVPWGWAFRIAEKLESQNVRVTIVKDGDHRLSRPEELELLWREITDLTQ